MELQEFVKYSLINIKNGVSGANAELGQGFFKLWMDNKGRPTIEFDVAVTVNSENEIAGKGGIKIAVVELGGGGTSKTTQESVSRIRFSVEPSQIIS